MERISIKEHLETLDHENAEAYARGLAEGVKQEAARQKKADDWICREREKELLQALEIVVNVALERIR